MKLEDQVCSLELAKKLKELGVKQESAFCFVAQKPWPDTKWKLDGTGSSIEEWVGEWRIAAFTVAELGEMLPESLCRDDYFCPLIIQKGMAHRWSVTYSSFNGQHGVDAIEADTEADARAKILVYLIENGLAQNKKSKGREGR